ncbi:hypothetical protein N9L26_01490 [Candidatus Pacebacteria bacterium]|nr:hypothetical protein [Candidatus Paceibacterota bacterium]
MYRSRTQLATILYYTGIVLGALLLTAYVVFQARVFIAGPQVSLTSDLNTIQTDRQITMKGLAENITEISINGREIVTDEAGNFSESIVLENGYTIVRIDAYDRYGRQTTLTREFVYTPLSLYTP